MQLIRPVLLSLLLAAFCYAQSNFGRISGTIEDASGAAVPGASVTATNAATGVKRQVTSDLSGAYVLPALEAGIYNIRVEGSGFKASNQNGVKLDAAGTRSTRGDGFVFLPKESVICTGDALANGGFNYVGNSNIRNWNNVLTKAKALGAKNVLPGHGRPGDAELFTGQMLFFTELQKAVQNEINRGKKLEELVFMDPNKDPKLMLGNLQTTVQLPPSVKDWISPDRLPRQVSDTYAQLSSK